MNYIDALSFKNCNHHNPVHIGNKKFLIFALSIYENQYTLFFYLWIKKMKNNAHIILIVLVFGISTLLCSCNTKTEKDNTAPKAETTSVDNDLKVEKNTVQKAGKEKTLITPKGGEIMNPDGTFKAMYQKEPYRVEDSEIIENQEGVEIKISVKELYKDQTKLAELKEESLWLLTNDFVTEKNIGIANTIEDFMKAYPSSKIWYTYVSDRFVIETPDLTGIQFIINASEYSGKQNILTQSDMVTLTEKDFKPGAEIIQVRILL